MPTIDHNGHSLVEIDVDCGARTRLVDGTAVYPRRRDLVHLRFYACACGAYVGVHKGTLQPWGRRRGRRRGPHAARSTPSSILSGGTGRTYPAPWRVARPTGG